MPSGGEAERLIGLGAQVSSALSSHPDLIDEEVAGRVEREGFHCKPWRRSVLQFGHMDNVETSKVLKVGADHVLLAEILSISTC